MNFASISQRRWLVPVLVVVLAIFYWLGAWQHLHQVNDRVKRTDQSSYLEYARQMAVSDYEFVGRRNRMPAFPFILSLVYEEGLATESFFVRAKHLNIVLSMLSLVAIWGVSRRWLPTLEATTLTAITAFGLYVYKSAYAQAEILFYTLSFFAFLSAISLLRRPSWPVALLTGALTGVAHMTKASMLPSELLPSALT